MVLNVLQVAVRTNISSLRGYFNHLLKTTNMRCLTPESALQVFLFDLTSLNSSLCFVAVCFFDTCSLAHIITGFFFSFPAFRVNVTSLRPISTRAACLARMRSPMFVSRKAAMARQVLTMTIFVSYSCLPVCLSAFSCMCLNYFSCDHNICRLPGTFEFAARLRALRSALATRSL